MLKKKDIVYINFKRIGKEDMVNDAFFKSIFLIRFSYSNNELEGGRTPFVQSLKKLFY